ncbi:MAG: ParB/RepB/Spo0J family partition protein [Clostridia bacterium]|nr:ParB/RepB/Spo0J family partition protein [Clostridia bacterium]
MARGLGKGFDSLHEETSRAYDNMYDGSGDVFSYTEEERQNASDVPLEKICVNTNQPRKNFDEQALNELADSIKKYGVIMPIVINDNGDGTYLIIAGERRFRAATIAGLASIPAVIRNYSQREINEISLIENLQREDLNPIEAATAMKQLMVEYKLTQDELAERIGKSRPAVANTLRLLNLTPEVIEMVKEGKISSGHARTLVPLTPEDQVDFAKEVLKSGMTVRQLEKKVRAHNIPVDDVEARRQKKKQLISIELKALVDRMRATFRTKVSLIGTDKKGRIYIDYYSKDDLDRLSEIMDIVDRQK